MKKRKKNSTVIIISTVFSAIGLLLVIAPKFVNSELNLSLIGDIFLGIGIITFLFVITSAKSN